MTVSERNTARGFDAAFAGHRGLDLVRGEGSFVFDRAGRSFLDATSMYGVASLGHAHPALAAAISRQASQLVACFASYGNDQRDGLLARLQRLAAPLERAFLCNSGTEAVEAALKIARRASGRPGVVALGGAFHGRTLGALSATFRSKHRDAFRPLLDGFVHVRPGDADALDRALDENVGTMIVEVIQGEGGVRPVDPEYLRMARELCRERGVLFCVDEVQTGIGRTGEWFAHTRHELDPDIVCLAKGLGGGVPIGATLFREEHSPGVGAHGSTFGGNPLACAAATAVIDTLDERDRMGEVAENGARLLELLEELLVSAEVQGVRAVRGAGLMIGIELAGPAIPIQKRLQEQGFLVLGAGPRVLRLLPPLTTPWVELERLAHAITSTIQEVSV